MTEAPIEMATCEISKQVNSANSKPLIKLTAATSGNFSSPPKRMTENATTNAVMINAIDLRLKPAPRYHSTQKGDIAVDNATITLL
jgi:hypothetical protein